MLSMLQLRLSRGALPLGGLLAMLAVLLTSGSAAAQTGTIVSGSIPPTGGFGIIVFGGGTNEQLVTASGCPEETAVFWATSGGQFITYVPGSNVGAVNAQWNALFAGGIPANTGLIGRCTDTPVSNDAFTLFFADEPASNPATQVTQTDIRVGEHAGFDRIVFEFDGDVLPGYRIEYLGGDAAQCGSGTTVPLQGNAVLQVTLSNTVAHDEGGTPTVSNSNPTPAFPNLLEIQGICDFEGVVQWAAGLDSQQPFRVFELTSPTRLVIDVKHQ